VRRAMLCSAKRGIVIACRRCRPFRLFVRPSATLVDQDHIGWKSWKLIARTINPTHSLFIGPKAIHLLPGEHGEILRRRRGVGKSGVLEHKSDNISETRKDRVKVTMEGL